jgi:hypothetical protein
MYVLLTQCVGVFFFGKEQTAMVYEHMWQQHTNSPDSKWCDAKD